MDHHHSDHAERVHHHALDYAPILHRHLNLQEQIAGLRDGLDLALARISQLEEQTPDARQLEHEADLAMVRDDQDEEDASETVLAECGCPEALGQIRHQRGICTDPIVARLNWYADAGDGGQ